MRRKKVVSIAIIVVIVLLCLLLIFRSVYSKTYDRNIACQIKSISMIDNVKNNDVIQQYMGKKIKDVSFEYGHDYKESEFDDTTFNLEFYNVYKINIHIDNNTDKSGYYEPTDIYKSNEYIVVPFEFGYFNANSSSSQDYYYFISKDYKINDIEQYLKDEGLKVKIGIDENELSVASELNKTIYYQ